MEKLGNAMQTILPMLLILGIGVLCRKGRVMQKQNIDGLKALIVNICVPVMLLRALYTASYSAEMIWITVMIFTVCLLTLSAGFLYTKLFCAPQITPYIMSSFEGGLLGLALYPLLFGQEAVSEFAIVNLGNALFVWTVYYTLLKRSQTGQRVTLSSTLLTISKSPSMIAIIVGVALGASGLGAMIHSSAAGGIVVQMLDFAAAPTAPVILFIVGFNLSLQRTSLNAILPIVLVRIVVMIVLCTVILLGLGAMLPFIAPLERAFIMLFILPTTYMLPILTKKEADTALSTAAISLGTIPTLIAFAVIVFIVA